MSCDGMYFAIARLCYALHLRYILSGQDWRRALEAYCMKCRTMREMSNTQAITLKNGRPATRGTCQVCSTKMFRIGKAA